MRLTTKRVWAAVLLLASSGLLVSRSQAQSPLPIFPGAQGFGVHTRAAYGGSVAPTVYRVTTLHDSGAGSLREALSARGPRVVIFDVSGTIDLTTKLIVEDPFVTVAGQTAPSPGITLRNGGISIRTHDVLIQHLRIRVGDSPSGDAPTNRDAIEILGSRSSSNGAFNVVVDHVSMSWAIDENASTWYEPSDITISNSIIGEGLLNSLRGGAHSKGMLIGYGTKRISVLRNIFLHNQDRNPVWQNGSEVMIVNNVMYNWGSSAATQIPLRGGPSGTQDQPFKVSIVGNVFIRGSSTARNAYAVQLREGAARNSHVYIADNVLKGDRLTLLRNDLSYDPLVSTPPIWSSTVSLLAESVVESMVLQSAGARPADRDPVDDRSVAWVTERAGSIIDSQHEVGGWPVLPVNHRSLTLPPNPHSVQPSGYTALEEWLHGLAAVVEGRAPGTTTSGPEPPTGLRIISSS